MMYMGSKRLIADRILAEIFARTPRGDSAWVEPFVGGANMMARVRGGRRIGADVHPYLIPMWQALQVGWTPPTSVSEELYNSIRENEKDYDPALVGFVGFLCSFGGKWWGGYAREATGRNRCAAAVRVLAKQAPSLAGVEFIRRDYRGLAVPPKSIIYCDPPYASSTEYSDTFSSGMFWRWARRMRGEGHAVYVSEYAAPDDFACILEIPVSTAMNRNERTARVERLFTPR